jgi:hypothetical protein
MRPGEPFSPTLETAIYAHDLDLVKEVLNCKARLRSANSMQLPMKRAAMSMRLCHCPFMAPTSPSPPFQVLQRPSISFSREVVKGQLAEFLCKSMVDVFIDIIYRSIGVSLSASGECFMNASRAVQVKSLASCGRCMSIARLGARNKCMDNDCILTKDLSTIN